MKNAGNWLKLYLIIALNSACAIAMGRSPAECSPILPTRPLVEVCLNNADGTYECFDKRRDPQGYTRRGTTQDFCTNKDDYFAQEEWIKNIKAICRGRE